MAYIFGMIGLLLRAGGGIDGTARRTPAGPPRPWWQVGTACLLHAVGAWLLVSALGAVTPAWTIPLAAVAATLIRGRASTGARPVLADLASIVVVAAAGVARTPVLPLAGAVVAFAAAGRLGDALAARWPRRVGDVLRPALLVAASVVAAVELAGYHRATWAHWPALARVAIAGPNAGTPADLGVDVAAWYAAPRGDARGTSVLLLHGASPAGSKQPASVALRAGLLAAGYPVLSIDTRGYGSTPSPGPGDRGDPAAWDEEEHLAAALALLADSARVAVVGHSMGSLLALRSLACGACAAVDRAVLFGAAMLPYMDRADYWYGRFHDDRGLPPAAVPRDAWRRIHEANFAPEAIARAVPIDHPPILSVQFEHEWEDVAATRDRYGELLAPPVATVRLDGSNHYVNSRARRGFVLVDAGVVRELSRRLPDWLEGPLPEARAGAAPPGLERPGGGA